MLDGYPALAAVVRTIDEYLVAAHPLYFGDSASHPVLPLKRSKVLHDNLWGTNRFSWRELALLDSPIFQRLRDIHQTGLAFQTYMCSRHTRFEHSIGVVEIASRVFEALLRRDGVQMRTIARAVAVAGESEDLILLRFKEEMRLAALLHDTGHSLFSHASERVFSQLSVVISASKELSRFVGKEKGAGEVLAFCLALSNSVKDLLERAGRHLIGEESTDDYRGQIDMTRIALLIVGRGPHPFLQFLGDIISSGFDADKLDYLMRDASGAGLPLRYDLDRYLYSVRLEKNTLVDGEGELRALYSAVDTNVEQKSAGGGVRFAYYDTYRLRLPKEAMNTIEQIVLCKLMLFSYIYHHPKVRAAEGLLEKMLDSAVRQWRTNGEDDHTILKRFLAATDSSLFSALESDNSVVVNYSYRIRNRLLPREVYGLGGADATHADEVLLTRFLTDLQKRSKREEIISEVERLIGEELKHQKSELADLTWQEANTTAGVWFDVPKLPKIEDVDDIVIGRNTGTKIPLTRAFPVGEWTEAYTHFKYQVRVFAFSEYWEATTVAGRKALEKVTGIADTDFYNGTKRQRD